MNRLLFRWLPCIALLVWSGVLLYFYYSGRITPFLAPAFRPGVAIAGVALAIMAVVVARARGDLTGCGPGSECCAASECGTGLASGAFGRLLAFFVLLVPISVAATVSPTGFSANFVQNRGVITDVTALGAPKRTIVAPKEDPLPTGGAESGNPDGATMPPENTAPPQDTTGRPADVGTISENKAVTDYLERTADGLIKVEVLDLLYAAQDSLLRKDFDEKKVHLIGQLLPDKTAPAGSKPRIKLVRMFVSCCAADARPVATLAEVEKLPELPDMTWVAVSGTATFPVESGRRVAILRVEKIAETEPPEENMLY